MLRLLPWVRGPLQRQKQPMDSPWAKRAVQHRKVRAVGRAPRPNALRDVVQLVPDAAEKPLVGYTERPLAPVEQRHE